MLKSYRAIFRHPGALTMSAAAGLARLPMSMAAISITLMIATLYGTPEDGNYTLAGQITGVNVVAMAIATPIIARYADRKGQAKVGFPLLILNVLLLGGLAVASVLQASTPVLLALAVGIGVTGVSIGSMVRARWSALTSDPRDIHTAFSFESVVDEAIFVVGPIVATTLATVVHPTAGLITAALAFAIGGALFLSQRRTEPAPVPQRREHAGHRKHPLSYPPVLAVVVTFVWVGMIFGGSDVAVVAFAEALGLKAFAGLVLGGFAAGSLVAGVGYGTRTWASSLGKRFVIFAGALGLGVTTFLLATSMWALAAAMFVIGFAIAPVLITGNQIVQFVVPAPRLTEGLAWVTTATSVGVAAGFSLGGVLIDDLGARGGFYLVTSAGVLAVLTALAFSKSLRGLRPAAIAEDEAEDEAGDQPGDSPGELSPAEPS